MGRTTQTKNESTYLEFDFTTHGSPLEYVSDLFLENRNARLDLTPHEQKANGFTDTSDGEIKKRRR